MVVILWSEYKYYYIFKVFVVIILNGVILYVFLCYGGRVFDIFIVRNSGFLNMIEFYDEVMVDRGFKIREDLMMYMVILCILFSCVLFM